MIYENLSESECSSYVSQIKEYYTGWPRLTFEDFCSRAESKIQYNDNGCWDWDGVKDRNGYSNGSVMGINTLMHRFFYRILVGEVPDGLELDHLCRRRGCINPDHLEPVTHAENMRRSKRTECRKGGHAYSEHGFVNSNGDRECRICSRESKLKRQRKFRDKGIGLRATWTHCQSGHPFVGENLIITAIGSRRCRICKNEYQRQYRAKKKEESLT